MIHIIKTVILISIFLLNACSNSPIYLVKNTDAPHKITYLTEAGRTLPPFGYVDFCLREATNCPEWRKENQNPLVANNPTATTLSPLYQTQNQNFIDNTMMNTHIYRYQPALSYEDTLRTLKYVNNLVNHSVRSTTDQEGFGVAENWRIPNINHYDIGDCEDFALLKRKILAQNGYDYNKLSMAVVRRNNNDIHAVLLVRTDYGDMVLDNLHDKIVSWDNTDYKWIKKQSVKDPYIWVSMKE